MRRQYTNGSLYYKAADKRDRTSEIVMISDYVNPSYTHKNGFQFVCFKLPYFMPLIGVSGDIAFIKRVIKNYQYIGNIKDLDMESFLAERIEAKPL